MKDKKIRIMIKVTICIVISIIIQTTVLLLVRKYYLNTNLEIQLTNVTTQIKENQDILKSKRYVTIPKDTEYVKCSYNGDYIFYISEGVAHVINYITKNDRVIELDINGDNTYFQWHDSENKLIISQTNNNGLKMYYYNPKTERVLEALDYNNEQRTYYLNSGDERVTGIRINNINTILYLKISTEYSDWINRLDISGQTNRLYTGIENIGNYFIIKELDQLVYEDYELGKVYTIEEGYNRQISIDDGDFLKLLGVDSGYIYIGKVTNGLITAIYSKDIFEINNEEANWNKLDIIPVDAANLLINEGNLFGVYNFNKIINLKTNEDYEYNGDLLSIKNNNLIIRNEDKIEKILFD